MADREYIDSLSDRELLARLLRAEAGTEDVLGRLAVGAVIRNRAQSGNFGEGLRGVMMKPGQFSPLNSVTGYASGEQGVDFSNIRPTEDDYRIADVVMRGEFEDPTGGATHFYNPKISQPSWGEEAGGEWQRIGQHIFGRTGSGRGSYEAPTSQSTPEARRVQYGTGDRDTGSMLDIMRARSEGLLSDSEAQELLSERLMNGREEASAADVFDAVGAMGNFAALTQQPQQSAPAPRSLPMRLSPGRTSATPGTQALKRMGVGSLLRDNPLLGMG